MAQTDRMFDRREFLKSSGLTAAAFGLLAAVPVGAQETQEKPAPTGDEPADGAAKGKDEPVPKELLDRDGRPYRICDVCGSNMYKQKDTWTCEQCGYSYVE